MHQNVKMFCIGVGFFALGVFTSIGLSKTLTTEAATPITYTYSSQGIVPVSNQYGLSLNDAEFLLNFDGPLVDFADGEAVPDELTLLPIVRTSLQEEYEQKHDILTQYFPYLSEEKLLLIFLVMRVNGSIPTYEPTLSVDPQHNLLVGSEGNCSHLSLRLMMVLNAFEIPGRALYVWTPSLQGHIAVEMYDETTGLTALLDPTLNLAFFLEGASKPFIDTIGEWSLAERQALLDEHQNKAYAPFMTRYYSPSYWLTNTEFPYSLEELNFLNSTQRIYGWSDSLSSELSILVSSWTWDSTSRPYNLTDYAEWAGRDFGPVYELDSETARYLTVQ